jgi:hypothetical protein
MRKILIILILNFLLIPTSFADNSEKRLDDLLKLLTRAGEQGVAIDLDLTAKSHGFKNFKEAVKIYKKKNKVKISVEDAKEFFIGIDRTIKIDYTRENADKLFEIITKSKYRGSKDYRKGYFKDATRELKNGMYTGFVISMNIEREFLKITQNPDLKKISPFTWEWGWHMDLKKLEENLMKWCQRDIKKYKIPFQECIIVDINLNNRLFEYTQQKINNVEDR